MQHATGSFPGQLSAAQRSPDPGCLLRACATQTRPVRGTIEGGILKRKGCVLFNTREKYIQSFPLSLWLTYSFLWQWRDDDVGVGDQQVCSEKLKLTVASPQSVGCRRRPSLGLSRPAESKVPLDLAVLYVM